MLISKYKYIIYCFLSCFLRKIISTECNNVIYFPSCNYEIKTPSKSTINNIKNLIDSTKRDIMNNNNSEEKTKDIFKNIILLRQHKKTISGSPELIQYLYSKKFPPCFDRLYLKEDNKSCKEITYIKDKNLNIPQGKNIEKIIFMDEIIFLLVNPNNEKSFYKQDYYSLQPTTPYMKEEESNTFLSLIF